MMNLSELKAHNPLWFKKETIRFFGDVPTSYCIEQGKKSKQYFLVRKTKAWTDMFGDRPEYFYVINQIKDGYKIGEMLDSRYKNKHSVKKALEEL